MSNFDHKLGRLSIRVSEHEKEVLTLAASSLSTTVSRFVRESAYAEAKAILGAQNRFTLDEKQWKKFCKALDAPPKNIPALTQLLSDSSVFDE